MAFGGGFRRGGGSFNRGRFDGPREMTKIKCAECGKEDEVPFKPREGSSVLCKDCFMKKKGITPQEHLDTAKEKVKEAEEEIEEAEEEMKEEEI